MIKSIILLRLFLFFILFLILSFLIFFENLIFVII